ncbi:MULTISPECIES: VOC family protein [unclassified Streptomyces]|uniref:VOC family protein n=1 Tax=unclassified Streptomyces TaxID=2593676 RepID=UPI002DDA80E1|nr:MULTISPECIES: VOC family protein [unclassified Streptomyces]WSA95259.1 VOC family protein [Streptomyces sp. NBC_01795]WSB79677.1 VOC family protein [Streptomyces sp. NBC_01775]WSS12120.1 VOC family protein [Streptomyces sp. NBC_01186]WSS40831.1 VOC family protein [Streptomyces sp. NBC_01187]
MQQPQKIKTFLWFDTQAQEAAEFYVSLFDNSRILETSRYTETGPGETGSVMTVLFELAGQQYVALNGGPVFSFTEAISLQVDCDSQEEVDSLWEKLTADGGQENDCGWLKDKYGLSWQIVPRRLMELISDPDRAKAAAVMAAMLTMKKLDLPALEAAAKQ